MDIASNAGVASALVATAGARVNCIFGRQHNRYSFATPPTTRPTESQVKAVVSHAGSVYTCVHGRGHLQVSRELMMVWHSGR